MKFLKGKKTYITGAGMILAGVLSHVQGQTNLAETIQLVGTGLLGLFLRKGIKDDAVTPPGY